MQKKEKGITLIALVITIIVLLILAGVSIVMLTGENGILNQTKQAKEVTEYKSEEEMIKLSIMDSKSKLEERYKVGKILYDKTIENGSKWNIIVTSEENKTYGTGWNYIPKGTEIESYGTTQKNWVVNESTGEITQLEDGKYVELSYDMNLGTKEGLIFNLDLAVIDTKNIEDIKNNIGNILGENVEFVNFDWNEESGVSKTSFNLDGINDYMKIKYDNQEQKEKLAKEGFTFEFYGTLNAGKSYNELNEMIEYGFKGLFCYWDGNENKQAPFRCGWNKDSNFVQWNAGLYSTVQSDYASQSAPWNIIYPLEELKQGEEGYITITVDCSQAYEKEGEQYYKQCLYFNGNKIYEGNYNKKNWDSFIKKELPNLQYFCIGRSSMKSDGWWHYSKMKVNALRLYNRALNEQEAKENYEKATAYHSAIIK